MPAFPSLRTVSSAFSLLALVFVSVAHAQSVTLTGTVLDKDYPVHRGYVRVSGPSGGPWLDSTVTDSAGRFHLALPIRPGCYRLQVRAVGYAVTERTFSISDTAVRELGAIPLHGAPIPEASALLLLGCAYPQAGAWGGAWGTDTVRVSP
jgi:hypothetical protein